MFNLFIDSSYYLTLGILNDKNEWIEIIFIDNNKNAQIIHSSIFNLLQKNNLSFKDINKVFFVLGPGSYTGLRTAKGLYDVFVWQGLETYSFYAHNIAEYCGILDGTFICNAFKGQYFKYTWNTKSKTSKVSLVDNSFMESSYYTNDKSLLNNENRHEDQSQSLAINTFDLIRLNSQLFFDNISSRNIQKPIYYFRKIYDEFKVPASKKIYKKDTKK